MTQNNPDRPETIIPATITVPATQSLTLPNGVSLYTIDCSEQEVVRFSFIFRAGTSLQETPFTASATANLLSEGTRLHSAHEIAEQLDFYGSYYDVSLDRDYVVITFCCLSKFFMQTVDTAKEILFTPVFSEHEILSYALKRKQRLAVERSKAPFQARELFSQSLFGHDHPYGVSYHQDLYDSLRRDDIVKFYNTHFTAGNCFMVASGRIKERETATLEQLGRMLPQNGGAATISYPSPEPIPQAFGEHPGAVQSSIRMGTLLFPRHHPDYIPMQVVTTTLGGYFGSRLVRNLREEKGYTYGAFSTVVNLEYTGYMAISTEVASAVTAPAVTEIYREMERLRTEEVSEEELLMVKNIMTGEVMRVLDGPFGIADVTIENIQNGTDNSYLDNFMETIRNITPEQVLETARKYLDGDRFTTVIVGDPSANIL